MIGIGERAGSGIPDIYQIWKNEGWAMPVVEEKYNPDRTCLTLTFAKKQAIKTSDKKQDQKNTGKTGCNKRIFTTKWFVKNECYSRIYRIESSANKKYFSKYERCCG